MKMRYLVPATLLLLAACSQAPAPESPTELSPTTFGTSGYENASGLAPHAGGAYAVGSTSGALHGPNAGNSDAFIRKYNASGALVWGRQFGTAEYDYAEGVAPDGSSGAYVVGSSYGSLAGSRGGSDAVVRRYNKNGSVLWTRQFGSSTFDTATDAAVSGSNTLYVVGWTLGNVAGSKGSYDGFIRKYNASGSVSWTKQFGTTSEDLVNDVAVDGSGNAYVVGYTYGSLGGPNGGGSDMFIRKYNTSGGVSWTRQLHFSDYDYGSAVAVYGSSVYLAGSYYYNDNPSDTDARVAKYSTSGSAGWSVSFGPVGTDYVNDVTADGSGVVFAGNTYTSFAGTNQGGGDGYVYKLNSSGAYLWGKQLGTGEHDDVQAVLLRGSELYAAGTTSGVLGSVNSGGSDAFIRQLRSSNGSTLWTDQ